MLMAIKGPFHARITASGVEAWLGEEPGRLFSPRTTSFDWDHPLS